MYIYKFIINIIIKSPKNVPIIYVNYDTPIYFNYYLIYNSLSNIGVFINIDEFKLNVYDINKVVKNYIEFSSSNNGNPIKYAINNTIIGNIIINYYVKFLFIV